MKPSGALIFYSKVDRGDFWSRELGKLMPELEVRTVTDRIERTDDVAYAIVWNLPEGELARLPKLKCIFSLGAGIDHILRDPTYPRHVPLSRVVDPMLTQGMVEYVTMHVLMHHRRDLDHRELQRLKKWRVMSQRRTAETRVGILGLGVLGLACARQLRSLGFDVAGWSSSRKNEPGIASFAGESELDAFLKRSDILVCLLPLTPTTRGILNARTFALLPKGACVINAGRGGHLVESDLIPSLESGQLKEATLDVFAVEPLPEDHKFWTHPKIVVTPHDASLTDPQSTAVSIVESIKRVEAGLPPLNRVDLARGY